MHPLSAVPIKSKGIHNITFGDCVGGVAGKLLMFTANRLRCFTLCFTSIAIFPSFVYDRKQRRFKIEVFFPLDGLPSWAVELYLPESADYLASFFSLRPFADLELNLAVIGYLRCVPQRHFINCGSLSLLSPAGIPTFGRYVYINLYTLS